MSGNYEEDIFRRTSIISQIDDCARIVEKIRGAKPVRPVAVDLEGIHLKNISLVQIKTHDDRIYLFRTGLNPELFTKGGIKDLLEDHAVIKVKNLQEFVKSKSSLIMYVSTGYAWCPV